MRSQVTSTYRFQLHSGFTFAQAQEQLDYVAELGVSHVYCSPILTAVAGSMHGYDVVDHTQINPELGGRSGFIAFADAAHSRGLGVVVDVVPNHMALVKPLSANRPLWQYLAQGPDAPTASWFDIDTQVEDGKIVLPILGGDIDSEIADGNLTLETDPELGQVVRYFDHIFPVADGSETAGSGTDAVAETIARQHYRLVNWRETERLNYRRFFDVNGLIAIRVEDEAVFDATHGLLLDLHDAGHIDAFRIDHPDGLADPQGYLDRLTSPVRPGTPIWVEKILEPGEQLPADWACAGTTGYDALAVMTSTLADERAATSWRSMFAKALPEGVPAEPEVATKEAKRFVVRNNLKPEVQRLARSAHRARPDLSVDAFASAIEEVLVNAPVYRAYLRPGEPMTSAAEAYLDEALTGAKESVAQRGADAGDALVAIGLLARGEGITDVQDAGAARDFAVRFQQTWGPAMAKSVEDTLFYRWNEMIAVNEVGAGVEIVGVQKPGAEDHRDSVNGLHAWAEHTVSNWPLAMTTLSTHDTKRSEDVRATLLAISGDIDGWRECCEAAFALADVLGIDREMAMLVWQTIAGMGLDVDGERLAEYLTKAMREAKTFTAWIDGDEEYEKLVHTFADAVITATEPAARAGDVSAMVQAQPELAWQLRRAIDAILTRNSAAVTLAGHTQKALQLIMPGVADTYQASEGPTLSLVDPDNRRPVDFAVLQANLSGGADGEGRADGSAATRGRLVQTLLAKDVQAVAGPAGGYEPLAASHDAVIAFLRAPRTSTLSKVADVVTPNAATRALGHEPGPGARVAFIGLRAFVRALADPELPTATVPLPSGRWRHLLTDNVVEVEGDSIDFGDLGETAYGPLHVLIEEK